MRISKDIPPEKIIPFFKAGKVKRLLDGLGEEIKRLEDRPYGFIMTLPLMAVLQIVMLIFAVFVMPFLFGGYCLKTAYDFCVKGK